MQENTDQINPNTQAQESATPDAYLASAFDQELNNQDKQMILDYQDLDPYAFASKYGADTLAQFNQQDQALKQAAGDLLLSETRSPWDRAKDATKNIIGAGLQGVVDTAGFAADVSLPGQILGHKFGYGFTEGAAKLSQLISEATDALGSDSEKAREHLYNLRQALNEADSQRQYERDIASGKSHGLSLLEREGRNLASSLDNMVHTGQIEKLGTQGIGSILSSAAVGGGVGGIAGKIGGKLGAKIAESPLPWMLSVGAQEGGNALTQGLNEGFAKYDPNTVDAKKFSEQAPEFAKRFQEYKAKGLSENDAKAKAITDLVHSSASDQAKTTAVAATGLAYLTKGLAKPFTKGDKTAGKYIGESFTEIPEEFATETTSQLAQNLATKHYLDKNQDIAEGVGRAGAEAIGGTMGIIGARTAQAGLPASLGATGKAIAGAAGLYDKAAHSERAVMNNVSHLERASEDLDKNEALKSLSDISDNLRDMAEEVFHKEADEETGEQKTTLTPERSIKLLGEIQNQLQTVTDTKTDTVEDKNLKVRANNAKRSATKALKSIQGGILDNLSAQLQEQRKAYETDKPLTQSQLDLEATYLSALKIADPKQAVVAFSKLSKATQTQLREATFTEPDIQQHMDVMFDRAPQSRVKPSEVNTKDVKKAEPEQATSEESSAEDLTITPIKTPQPAVKPKASVQPEPKASEQAQQPKPQSQAPQVPEPTGFRELAPHEINHPNDVAMRINLPFKGVKSAFHIDKDNNFNIELNDKVYRLSEEEADAIEPYLEAMYDNSTPETQAQFAKAVAEPVKKIAKHLKAQQEAQKAQPQTKQPQPQKTEPESQQAFKIKDKEGKEEVLTISKDSYTYKGQTQALPKTVKETLANPKASEADKVDAVRTLFRQSQTLDPELLERQNKYLEDGEIKDYDSEEVRNAFQTLKTTFSGIMVPVKRAIHLWQDPYPLTTFRNLIADHNKLSEYLRINHLTNAGSLLNTLFTVNGELDTKTNPNSKSLAKNTSLANQILAFLHPEGVYMTRLMPSLLKTITESKHIHLGLRKELLDNQGNLDNQMADILAIAGAQWIASMDVLRHQLTERDLENLGLDPSIQAEDLDTTDSYPSVLALQSLATTIRKTMGVAKNNKATDLAFERTIGCLAFTLAKAMINADLIGTSEVPIRVRKDGKVVNSTMLGLRPTPDFRRLFRPKADILLQLLDPTFKNAWSTTPIAPKQTYAHTEAPVSKSTKQAIEAENRKPASINTYFLSALASIGGEDGLTQLFGIKAEPATRHLFTVKDYISQKGKQLSSRLAFDMIKEVMIGNPNVNLKDLVLYMSHVAIKNSRIMQEGAATYQANKIVRQMLNYMNSKAHDLTNTDLLNAWKLTLAQKLGESVNRNTTDAFIGKVDSAVDMVRKACKDPKYKDALDSLITSDAKDILHEPDEAKCTENRKALRSFISKFNKQDSGYEINNAESFNALVEMVRFVKAEEASELNKFDSRIFLEVDGINDGPSYINNIFTLAKANFTPQFVRIAAKTGTNIGVNTTSQKTLGKDENGKPSKESELMGTYAEDLHAEVAQRRVTEFFLKRLINFQQDLKDTSASNSRKAQQAQLGLKATQAMLTFFKAIGWLKGDIDATMSMTKLPSDPSDYPFTFHREISKKLLTSIVYGSGVKGATRQVLRLGIRAFHSDISKRLKHIGSSVASPAANRVKKFKKAVENGVVYVVDTETTGLNVRKDAVVQISIRKLDHGKEVESKNYWLKNNTDREIPEFFDKVKKKRNPAYVGYQNAEAKGLLREPEDVYNEMAQFVGDGILIGHNFDNFDAKILKQHSKGKIQNKSLDTLPLARDLLSLQSNKLDDIKAFLGLKSIGDAHLADADTATNVGLINELLKQSDSFLEREAESRDFDKDFDPDDFNGVDFADSMDALKTLFGIQFTHNGTFRETPKDDEVVRVHNLVDHLPTAEELADGDIVENTHNHILMRDGKPLKDDVRNFDITPDGLEHLTEVLVPIFGEPAYAAVVETLGSDGMKAARLPTAWMGIFNLLAKGMERLEEARAFGSLKMTTGIQQHRARNRVAAVSPDVLFPGGTRAIIQKTRFLTDEAPLYEDEDTGLAFISSAAHRDSAGVSGGPLTTQAVGDATTAQQLIEMLRDLANFGQVFDGFYTSIDKIDDVSSSANKASLFAQRQRIIGAFLRRANQIGKYLIVNDYAKSTEPLEAIKECLVNMAQGKLLNGTKIDDPETLPRDILRDISSYVEATVDNGTFEPSLYKQETKRRTAQQEKRFKNKKPSDDVLASELTQCLDTFFHETAVTVFNEKVKHEVMDSLPKSVHHMSASDVNYKDGSPLEVDEAEALLKEVNKFNKQHPFADWAELMSAYLNYLATSLVSSKYADDPKYADVVKDWQELMGRNQGNEGVRTYLNSPTVHLLHKAFNGRAGKEKFEAYQGFRSQKTLSRKDLVDAFNRRAQSSKYPAIYKSLFRKLSSLLPKNLKISMVGSIEALPQELQECFTNSSQAGVFTIMNGEPHIVIIDQGSRMNPLDHRNAATLVHEGIHAVITQALVQFDADKKVEPKNRKLSNEQFIAIENLEKLLEDFLENAKNNRNIVAPSCVDRLCDILQNTDGPAKLDESLAYLFSNMDLFDAFAKYQMTHPEEHRKRFGHLLEKVVTAAKNAWKHLMNIVTGSPMAKALNLEETNKKLAEKPMDFLSLYGVNTLVFLNEEQKRRKQKPKKDDGSRLNADISRPMFSDDFLFGRKPTSNFFKALEQKVKADTLVKVLGDAQGSIKEIAGKLSTQGNLAMAEELNRFARFRDAVVNTVRPHLDHPGEFADTFVHLLTPDAMTPKDRLALAKIYENVTKNLNPLSFVDNPKTATKEDLEDSEFLYDLIKGNISPTLRENIDLPDNVHTYWQAPAVLFALAQCNPELADKLDKASIDVAKAKTSWKTPSESLQELGNHLAEDWIAKEYNGKTASEILKEAGDTANAINHPESNDLMSKTDEFLHTVDHGLFDTLGFILRGTGLGTEGTIAEFLRTARDNPMTAYYQATESMRKFANTHFDGLGLAFSRDFYRRTMSNSDVERLLNRLKGFFDRLRKANLDEFPENLAKAFKCKADRKLKKFLYRTMAQTDLSCLTFDEASKAIESDASLDQMINDWVDELRNIAPDYVDRYVAKADQLANYLVGSRVPGHNLLTNAVSIARLLGEGDLMEIPVDSQEVHLINRLTTLLCLKHLSKNDRKALRRLFKEEQQGMKETLSQMQKTMELEASRCVNRSRYHVHNQLKGWMPRGNQPSGQYVIVPQKMEQELKNKGYITLGSYKASNVDSSKAMVRMYCKYPHNTAYQEGIIQCINQTCFGFQISNGTRGEALGTRITDSDVVKDIYDNYMKESGDNGVIPLYDRDGYAIGYERAIPSADRAYVEEAVDLFSGIAQYRVRQTRENLAEEINEAAIQMAYSDWDKADFKERSTQFIDLFHTDDRALQLAVSHLDGKTLARIRSVFGGDHFYVKKDIAINYVGTQRASLTDVWDNNFILPDSVETGIAKCLNVLFPNGKARYYVGNFEKSVMGAVAFAKDTIVSRSGVVPLINATANIVILTTVLGIPIKEIYRQYKENTAYTQMYNKLSREVRDLEYKLGTSVSMAEKLKIEDQIKNKNLQIQSLPIFPLIAEGEYSTISPEGVVYEEVEIGKQKLDDALASWSNKLPKGASIRKGVSEALMLRGSESFKLMTEFTSLGDWIAKCTAYRHLTEGSNEYRRTKVNHRVALGITSTLFVDYNQFSGRERDWAQRFGLTWFMTYKYRMVSAAFLSMFFNPTRLLIGSFLDSTLGLQSGTPLTENIFAKIAEGKLGYSLGWDMLFRGILMHPLALILGLCK